MLFPESWKVTIQRRRGLLRAERVCGERELSMVSGRFPTVVLSSRADVLLAPVLSPGSRGVRAARSGRSKRDAVLESARRCATSNLAGRHIAPISSRCVERTPAHRDDVPQHGRPVPAVNGGECCIGGTREAAERLPCRPCRHRQSRRARRRLGTCGPPRSSRRRRYAIPCLINVCRDRHGPCRTLAF